ncbi:MAG: hypothetical protein K6F86_07755 [Lachnospiraceae bacterium]|nr:hypothetical protein [Lachnospiraceae bacterium]
MKPEHKKMKQIYGDDYDLLLQLTKLLYTSAIGTASIHPGLCEKMNYILLNQIKQNFGEEILDKVIHLREHIDHPALLKEFKNHYAPDKKFQLWGLNTCTVKMYNRSPELHLECNKCRTLNAYTATKCINCNSEFYTPTYKRSTRPPFDEKK